MIRQGLVEPPNSKVKMSNLMKVLGSEATQDPTKLEMDIRSAAAGREQAHADRNIGHKLTPEKHRAKKERKLFDDPNIAPETIVSENCLTGCAVILEGISVVVIEGGKKSIKRYGKLMLRRIDWVAAGKKEDGEVKMMVIILSTSVCWFGKKSTFDALHAYEIDDPNWNLSYMFPKAVEDLKSIRKICSVFDAEVQKLEAIDTSLGQRLL
ncbi:hypothetical protein FXO38_02860 [Capsicum annuum]|nr:hypothetical protein FXO38_02860 [Capsicum annuum]KAF3683437.1 hypothetical protein FXO37_01861 [Capsicum annuum]